MNRITLIAGGALALAAFSASAEDHIVTATPQRTFDPPTLTIAVGDTVTFVNGGGFHNVVSDTGVVPAFRCANGCDGDGAGGNGDADDNAWEATVTFSTAGSVPYHCEIHGGNGGAGMSGTITVGGGGGAPVIGVDPTTLAGSAEEGQSTTVPLTISNTGDAQLDWTAASATATCDTLDGVPWIALDPAAGSIAEGDPETPITVTLDAASLTAGLYVANICVSSNDTANDLVTVPVEFTVNIPDVIFINGFDPDLR